MVRFHKKTGALLFALVIAATLLFAMPAKSVSAASDLKEGVHADIRTFEKNFSLTVAQKIYSIDRIQRAVSIVTEPDMSDLEKYYRLALWANDHVTYDGQFWNGGYDFKYYRHQWDAYGALTDTSVCAGISILYANLCHAADLPCKFVRTYPQHLDHTINYIPDINGNAYYIDVTEAQFFSSEKSNAFGDVIDKKFAFITKDCTDGTFDYKANVDYQDVVDIKDAADYKEGDTLSLATSNIKDYFKKSYASWFKEHALHEDTTKEFIAPYVEKGSGKRGEHYASYRDYPKQFSATEKPGLWFLEDFYKDPEKISFKILNKELDGQLVNIPEFEERPTCSSISELETFLRNNLQVVGYFPSVENNEIVPEEANLMLNTDFKTAVKSFDKAKGEAVIAIQAMGNYKGTYQFTLKLATPAVKKAANPMKVKAKKATVKYSKLKKKSQIIKRAKAIKISKAKGKLKFKYVTAKKGKKYFKKCFKIGKKSGNIKVKKGLKKGTYRVKVKVKAAGNAAYKASAWKTVIFKVRVK